MVDLKSLLMVPVIFASVTLDGIVNKAFSQNTFQPKDPCIQIYYSMHRDGKTLWLSDFPLYMRDVPIHKDDARWKANQAPIDDVELSPMSGMDQTVELMFGKNFIYRNTAFRWAAGLNFDVDKSDPRPGFGDNTFIMERNYLPPAGGNVRGTGTALTYYLLNNRNIEPIISLQHSKTIGRMYSGSQEGTVDLCVEYYARWTRLFLENGWDRYNKLQKKSRYDVANFITHSMEVKIQVEIPDELYLEFFGGYMFANPITKKVDLRQVSLIDPGRLTFGVRIGRTYKL